MSKIPEGKEELHRVIVLISDCLNLNKVDFIMGSNALMSVLVTNARNTGIPFNDFERVVTASLRQAKKYWD